MMTSRAVNDKLVPVVTIGAPVLCAIIEFNQAQLFTSYRLGLELLTVNGILVFAGLLLISKRQLTAAESPYNLLPES
jgi:hypothetical protein